MPYPDLGPITNEGFPVVAADSVEPGSWHPFQLFDRRLILLCDSDGAVTVVPDTCPHRGAQLSLGGFDGERVKCPYHGWEFDTSGGCVHQPAHPDRSPPEASGLEVFRTIEAYGLWWVCLGDTPRKLPLYPAYERNAELSVIVGPKSVMSSGPRIVENFLDLAHFPFVHPDTLGQEPHTGIGRYAVDVVDEELRVTGATVWQPSPGAQSTQGGPVAYEYSVSHPYAATLTKVPGDEDGGELNGFSIMLVARPVSEVECVVWMVVTVRDPAADLEAQRAFDTAILAQDVPIVESQLPKRLPVDSDAEVHQPADLASLTYRKWLIERGIRYGTTAKA